MHEHDSNHAVGALTRRFTLVELLVAGLLLAGAQSAHAGATLTGTPTDTRVSGKTGSVFITEGANSATHAMFGISSRERSDEPCQVTIMKEDINDSSNVSKRTTQNKNLCGPNGPTSSTMSVNYSDASSHGTRVYVTGIQVCMNNDKTKVKGFKLRGNKIDDSDRLVPLVLTSPGSRTEPYAVRTNCDEKDGWMAWAECPAGQVATAAKLHFGGGNEPRSLVGVALQCRTVEKK